jgi:NAD(P)-dependent dehydrogenase (short-subunit alcohol dehydrogenase family)
MTDGDDRGLGIGPLSGRKVGVTGASSGIGAAICEAMLEAGADVLLMGRDRKRLGAIARENVTGAGHAYVCPVDLTAPDASETVVNRVCEVFGGVIDVIVHSAGVCEWANFADSDPARFESHWRINVSAPFELSRAILPRIPRGGSIIFVSSMAATIGLPGRAMYGATKGAIESLTRCLAVELGPQGIRVNAISPGFISTPMNEVLRARADVVDHAVAATPLGRLGTPRDVSEVVAFLASERAGFISGAIIPVGGGYPAPLLAPIGRAQYESEVVVMPTQDPAGGRTRSSR